MSNLAFADLCLGLYLLLIAAIDVHSMGEYFNFGYEWQYGKYIVQVIINKSVENEINKYRCSLNSIANN